MPELPPGAAPESDRLQRVPRPRPSREDLLAALAAHGWSTRAAARHLGREREQISRWIEIHGLTSLARDEDQSPPAWGVHAGRPPRQKAFDKRTGLR